MHKILFTLFLLMVVSNIGAMEIAEQNKTALEDAKNRLNYFLTATMDNKDEEIRLEVALLLDYLFCPEKFELPLATIKKDDPELLPLVNTLIERYHLVADGASYKLGITEPTP